MTLRHLSFVVLMHLCPLLWPGLAQAQTSAPSELDPRLEEARAEEQVHLRLELTMGFAGGLGRYSEIGLTGNPALPPGTFDGGPASGAGMAGLRYDLRLVVSFVRMTIGGDLLWGLFDGTTSRTLDEGGTPITIADRRLFDGALRFGLGLEANVDGVRLFADVIGMLHFVEATVERQGDAVTHRAVAFSPGLRLGVRIPIVEHFFVQVAADGTPFGPSYFGGDLSVGGAIE